MISSPGAPPDDDDLDALSSSQAPLGTRDHRPRDDATRIESPAARNRTPPPPTPAQVAPDPPRKPRASRPPAGGGERPEERIGSVLGSYRILELLGKGGMGFVYRAEHVKLGRVVALKLLRADYARRRDSVARFFQEARTVNRVRHRNIVDVTDFVELDDGTTFIIMELLEGQSLGRWAKGGFSIPRALALLIQICDGLAAAHAVGVIHRDLKPDNVVVLPTGDGAEVIKLLDFGVAKLLNRDDEDIGLETQAGSVIGTPAYMSPEQAGGTVVDGRSDIYSLGAIMYELFTGQPMFRGRSFGEYVRKHLSELPVPPRRTPGGAALDDRLEAVILRCLEKDPRRRYQDLPTLRDELLHLLGGIETAVGLAGGGDGARTGYGLGATDSLSSKDLLSASARLSARASAVHPGSASYGGPPGHDVVHAPTPAPTPMAMALPTATAYAPAPRRWPWVIAVGAVGVSAAVAVAIAIGGDAPAPAPAAPPPGAAAATPAAPTVQPLEEPGAAQAAHRPIEVRIDSTPGGDVYPAGSTTRRCSTPCTVVVDPGDGGSATVRDFVVRRAGYRDQVVRVDLVTPPPSIEVELVRESGNRTRPEPTTRPEPDRKPEPTTGPPPDRRPEPTTGPPPDRKPEPTTGPPPDRKPEPDKPPDKTPPKKIDPTDTLDPFR